MTPKNIANTLCSGRLCKNSLNEAVLNSPTNRMAKRTISTIDSVLKLNIVSIIFLRLGAM